MERRRVSDQKLERLDEMIEEEQDPKIRGLLLVLRCIGEEVVMAGQQITQHSNILSWKSLVTILAIIQAPIGYVYLSIQDMKEQQNRFKYEQAQLLENQKRFDADLKGHVIIFQEYMRSHK